MILENTGAIPIDIVKNNKLLGLSAHLCKPMEKAVGSFPTTRTFPSLFLKTTKI